MFNCCFTRHKLPRCPGYGRSHHPSAKLIWRENIGLCPPIPRCVLLCSWACSGGCLPPVSLGYSFKWTELAEEDGSHPNLADWPWSHSFSRNEFPGVPSTVKLFAGSRNRNPKRVRFEFPECHTWGLYLLSLPSWAKSKGNLARVGRRLTLGLGTGR